MFSFKSFIMMDVVETNHLALTESGVQVKATSPEISLAGMFKLLGRETAVGNSALLPIIVVRCHHSTITILGKLNLQHLSSPEGHLLARIVGRGYPGKGGVMLVPCLVLPGLLLPGLVLPVLVLPVLVLPVLVLPLFPVVLVGSVLAESMVLPVPGPELVLGRAPAATRVAKVRAEMTLNCILFCFLLL